MKAMEYNALIPLTDMAEFLGYTHNPQKGKRGALWVVYDKFIDGKKDHSIVINRKRNTYFCQQNHEHGSLVQFVKNRVREFPSWKPCSRDAFDPAWEETKAVLDDYLGPGIHTGVIPSLPDPRTRTFRLTDYDIYFPSPQRAKTQHFLVDIRHISVETVAFFLELKAIAHIKDKTMEFAYSNYGFPMRIPGNDEIVNFELRNFNSRKGLAFKGFCPGGNKADALWIAPFTDPDKVSDVFVFESAIDALSFCDLVHPSPTSAVVSCGGYMTYGGISRLPGMFPSAQFHSCCDNDVAGNLYDVMLAYFLRGIHIQAHQLDVREKDDSWRRNVQIAIPEKEPVTLPADSFNGRSFLAKNNMNNVIIRHCATQFKDWNEHLCSHLSNRTEKDMRITHSSNP